MNPRFEVGVVDAPARELARQLAFSRREFLRSSARLALGGALLVSSSLACAATPLAKRKVVVVTFGGGARDQETSAAPAWLRSLFVPGLV